MKKLFKHTKKPAGNWEDYEDYDDSDYDWDESAYEEYDGEDDYDYYIEEQSEETGYYEESDGAGGVGSRAGAEYYGETDYRETEDAGSEAFAEAENYAETDGVEGAGCYGDPENYGEPEYVQEPEGRVEAEYYEGTVDAGGSAVYDEAEYYGEPEEAEYEREPENLGEAEYAEYYEGTVDAGGSAVFEEAEYYGEPGEAEYEREPENLGEAEYAEYYEGTGDAGEGTVFEEAEYYGEPEDMEEAESFPEPEYDEEQAYDAQDLSEEDEQCPRRGLFRKLRQGTGSMGGMDMVILGTGVAVLILALVTGILYFNSRNTDRQVADFANVGSQLEGIDVIGGQGLLAVADAELARRAAAEAVQEQETEPPREYQEAEYGREITVTLNLTSVQKDLKIKFVNKANGKLISNVPFAVAVTGPDGKSVVWSDDDMDGIIYKKDIAPGTYTVVMEPFSGDQYSNYDISGASQKVEVKKDIAYEKVDVANEIKKESEVNAAKEDTKQNITVVESTLADTVEWVDSKVMDAVYNEVPKSAIPDPAALVSAGRAGTLYQVAEIQTAETQAAVSGGNPATPTPTPLLLEMTLDLSEVTLLSTATAAVKATLTGTSAAAPVVSAASADPNVAAVSVSGTEVTVTGVNAGSTAVTVSYTENNQTVTKDFTVTVKSHPKDDRSTPLKDADGNQLYVYADDQYRMACYADYYSADKFYIMGDVRYTGWQTLNGNVYYFTADGEAVTGEQVIQGAKYNFASDGSLVKGSGDMGIDVSKWNGNIDWTAVSNSGVSYVIIRCGYRGSSEGKLIEDPKFAANIKGATAAGLKVGVYFFTQAVNEVEAVEEASMVLEQIRGYKISYPVFLDVEPSGGRADSIDSAARTAICRTFCETIQRSGYTAGVYANKTWLTDRLNASELSAYKIWLAQYSAAPTYTGKYDLWQYKSTGSVSGIQGKVDMNLSYLGY